MCGPTTLQNILLSSQVMRGAFHAFGKRFEHKKINQKTFYASTTYHDSGVQRKHYCSCYCLLDEHGFEKVVADMKAYRGSHPPLMKGDDEESLFSDFLTKVQLLQSVPTYSRDESHCITMWTYKKGNKEGTRNAYLVFPNVKMTYLDENVGKG